MYIGLSLGPENYGGATTWKQVRVGEAKPTVNRWYPMIGLPRDSFTTPSHAEAWFLSGEFFSPGAPRGPFVQPGRTGGRAHGPIPADDQWSRATAFFQSRSPSLLVSPILSLSYLSLPLLLPERASPYLLLRRSPSRTSLVPPTFLTRDETPYPGPYINDA